MESEPTEFLGLIPNISRGKEAVGPVSEDRDAHTMKTVGEDFSTKLENITTSFEGHCN